MRTIGKVLCPNESSSSTESQDAWMCVGHGLLHVHYRTYKIAIVATCGTPAHLLALPPPEVNGATVAAASSRLKAAYAR